MKRSHKIVQSRAGKAIVEWVLVLRTLLFIGRKHHCPCCGWSLRTFTKGARSFRSRPHGYCPRCNSKPRHRWLWLYLKEQTNVLTQPQKLLHVSPAYSTGWAFQKQSHLNYVSGEIKRRAFINTLFDLKISPFAADTFDTILCIHVLEHVDEDIPAISELYRVLQPGGTAIVAVPIRMDQATYEDPTITSPEGRKQHFGEEDHKRFYGHDLIQRLEQAGFSVEPIYAKDRPEQDIIRYDLKREEVMLICRK